MPFPASQRVVYERNPLVEVICQLRFPTILEIASEEPAAFQKKIRQWYPLYSKEEPEVPLPKELAGLVGGLGFPKLAELMTHKFVTDDSQRYVSLTREFLAITETKYRRWEEFSAAMEFVQAALEEVYNPAFYSRIGLRYRNIINRAALGLENEAWRSLVNPSVVGVLGAGELSGRVEEIGTRTLVKIDEVDGGFVALRHGIPRKSPTEGQVYMIDADFFTEDRRATKNVSGVLAIFNRLAGNLFRWAITPRLQEALGPVAIE